MSAARKSSAKVRCQVLKSAMESRMASECQLWEVMLILMQIKAKVKKNYDSDKAKYKMK